MWQQLKWLPSIYKLIVELTAKERISSFQKKEKVALNPQRS